MVVIRRRKTSKKPRSGTFKKGTRTLDTSRSRKTKSKSQGVSVTIKKSPPKRRSSSSSRGSGVSVTIKQPTILPKKQKKVRERVRTVIQRVEVPFLDSPQSQNVPKGRDRFRRFRRGSFSSTSSQREVRTSGERSEARFGRRVTAAGRFTGRTREGF